MKKLLNYIRNFGSYWWNRANAFVRRFRKQQHQVTSTTGFNRYPELFEEIRIAMDGRTDIKILSYGCSTGEECFSLRTYFPAAVITGVDISSGNLRKAKRKNADPRIQFLLSTPETIRDHGPYDIICCLSVLCRWEDTKDLENCSKVYPFEKFNDATDFISGNVISGGLLVIYNSNFRFEESSAFSQFKVINTPTIPDSGFVHKFDRHNNRVLAEHKNCIYQKRS